MKQLSLFLATLCCLAVTGFVLEKAGWLGVTRGMSALQRRAEVRATVKAQDPLLTEAGLRWRRAAPHHWRACMLQR